MGMLMFPTLERQLFLKALLLKVSVYRISFCSLALKHLFFITKCEQKLGTIWAIYITYKETGTHAHCLYITQQMSVNQFISGKVGMHKCYLHSICPAAENNCCCFCMELTFFLPCSLSRTETLKSPNNKLKVFTVFCSIRF